MNSIPSYIKKIQLGTDLQAAEMEDAIGLMMSGAVSQNEMGSLLLALKKKGEAVSEIVGAARAMRSKMSSISSSRSDLVDTCGTGGDGSGTFNVSTAAAIVAAGAGISIAKHGNRKVSSKTGSADVLTELGVNVSSSKETVENCLNEVGLCFCFAPLFHESVKNVGAVRKSLGVPTIFNLLGPLCNPAGASFQLVGVGNPDQRQRIAAALQQLGTTRSVVVHGNDGICEVSNSSTTAVTMVNPNELKSVTWEPEDFQLKGSTRSAILASDPQQSAGLIQKVLNGENCPARDIVVMNAAAAIWLVGHEGDNLAVCAKKAIESIDSGAAYRKLTRLAVLSQMN
ncbi:anthranilate phosphoribosyltransferase [Mariniblastus sp.]|nr:anthranilate phosphoribosyltransferase [Mariniblastus sp.]MDB4756609.1 anthranilate phosphoribosyltransferase [Mariniblastus sp.]